MRILQRGAWIVFWTFLILYSLVVGVISAQAPKSQMEYYVNERAVPETFVVRLTVQDTALVCAEPDKGMVTCKSVGEFRKWVRERPVSKK
jgi:hypothetical protein